MRFALLADTKTISSCWTWYSTDIYFPFLLLHNQSCRVIRIWNNNKLLDMVWYWFFSAFLTKSDNESPLLSDTKKNQFDGRGMILIFLFLFYHPTIRVAVSLDFETISKCWTWYGTDISFPFLSPHYQSCRVIRFWNIINFLDLVSH